MQFFTDAKRTAYNALKGALPAKLYIPLNAGRRVGARNNKAAGSYLQKKPADQVEMGAWLAGREAPVVYTALAGGSTFTAKTGTATYAIDTQAGVATLNLPPAGTNNGTLIRVIRTGTGVNAITIDGYSSETINGATTLATLDAQYDSATLLSDGTEWFIVASNIA